MAAGDLVQKGTVVHVGFGGNVHTNLIMSAASETTGAANVSSIRSEQGATVTHIIKNPSRAVRLTGVLKGSALTTVRALKMGDAVSITHGGVATVYFISAAPEIEMGVAEARVSIQLLKQEAWTHA